MKLTNHLLLAFSVRFHIANMLKLQEKVRLAKLLYEQLLEHPANLTIPVKTNILRLLGWLYHSVDGQLPVT